MEFAIGPRKLWLYNLKQIDEYLSEDFTHCEPGNIYLDLELKEYSEEAYEGICKLLKKCASESGAANVSVDLIASKNGFMFSEKEWERLTKIEELANKAGIMCFYDEYDYYLSEQVLRSYQFFKTSADYINNATNSNLEKFLMAYNLTSQFVYSNENSEDAGSSRSLIQIFNNTNIVCVGYASILEFLCKQIGIICNTQHVKVGKCNYPANHSNCYVLIEDEKYGINGIYYTDPCWDSVREGQQSMERYAYCLIPLTDIFKMKDEMSIYGCVSYLYEKNEKEDFYPLIYNYKDLDSAYSKFDRLLKHFMDKNNIKVKSFSKEEILSRINEASAKLAELYKSNNIQGNEFFNKNIMITKYNPMTHLILLMDNKNNYGLVEKYTLDYLNNKDTIKANGFSKGKMIYIDEFLTKDIYSWLQNINNGRLPIDGYFNNYQSVKLFKKFVDYYQSHSKPVSIENFKKAIINTQKHFGFGEKLSAQKAEQALNLTLNVAKNNFKQDAENCFLKEALKREIKQKA